MLSNILQLNTFENLANLGPVPKMTVGEMLELCGPESVGLGTLWNRNGKVRGELTIVDGKAFLSKAFYNEHGEPSHVRTKELKGRRGLNQMVYFAQIGYIPSVQGSEVNEPYQSIKLEADFSTDSDILKRKREYPNSTDKELLGWYIDKKVFNYKNQDIIDDERIASGRYVFKGEIKFEQATFRSVDGAVKIEPTFPNGTYGKRKPKNLGEVIGNQVNVEHSGATFTCAGVFNDMEKGGVAESPEGIHIHGINGEAGGHLQVQNMEIKSINITVMPVEQWLILTRGRYNARNARYSSDLPNSRVTLDEKGAVATKANTDLGDSRVNEVRENNRQFTGAGYGLNGGR